MDTAPSCFFFYCPFVIRASTIRNGISRITSVTRISDLTLVIAPNRIGSHPPYPSKGDGGHDTIRVHVRSVRPGSPGDVTDGGAAPAHPSSSRARSRRGNAAGRPARWMPMASHVCVQREQQHSLHWPRACAAYMRSECHCALPDAKAHNAREAAAVS
jgi:hypothetical protein